MIESEPYFLQSLNDRQREAALWTTGPLVVLAGAGSGKTKMLTSRIAYLIQVKQVPAYQVLAVTFTNKAAAEMRERVSKLALGASVRSSWESPEIGTFHSVCIRLLRRELASTLFTQPFVIYDDSDQLSLIKGVMRRLEIDEKSFNPKSIQAGINRAKCDAKEPHEIEVVSHNVFARQLAKVYEAYQKELIANNALDFGEIICLTYRLLRDRLDLRAKYQQRFRYIHVDEFQDTNRSQYLLLSLLSSAQFGGHQNICVVGDEDQSIYKWRGADIKNILDFQSDYPSAHFVKLEQNYRSTKNILSVANYLIRNNKDRKEKTLWTENAQGCLVVRAQVADERAEAEMVVSELKRLAEADGRSYDDFAVFYRTNAQSRQFEDVLRREKIAYQIIGGLRFYDRKEIKDILSYFKLILNTSDSISLKRVINVPARAIGKTTIEKLDLYYSQQEKSESFSYWNILQRASLDSTVTSAATAKKIKQFVQIIERLKEAQPGSLLSELYHKILDETGYVQELRKEGTEEALSRIENLEEFNTMIQEFEEDQVKGLTGPELSIKKADLLSIFIEQSALASGTSELNQSDPSLSSVKLMTLHSSKGLEFPVAFLVGMEEGLFPSVKAWEEAPEEDIAEERRLCYVGMTRAREVLYLTGAVIRRIWGNVSYQEPSRFFSEIPDELIEYRDFSVGIRVTEYRIGSSRSLGFGRASDLTSSKVSLTNSPNVSGSKSDWVGRSLHHPDYGKGTVVASEGLGQDQKVTIQFLDRQQKKFLLRYIESYFLGNQL